MTFPHLMGYLAAALLGAIVWLSNLDPSNLAFLGPNAVKWGTAGVALAGAVLLFMHQTGWIPAKKSGPDAATITKVLVPLVLILPMVTGCATVGNWFATDPAAPVVVTISVDVAVAAAEQNGVKASDINRIAQIALAADQGTTATLAAVSAAVNAEITKLNLPPLDLAAANALEALVSAAVQQKLAGNADLASAQAAVSQVLTAVIAATGGASTTRVAPAEVPQQNKHFVLSSVESPQVVGASASLVLIACLQAFAHLNVNAPTGAAITVLFTVGAAALDNLIS
jgi:hypothetical protein